jgi:hypothetical protein
VDVPDRFPQALRTMLHLDPVRGREYLDGWIALNEHAARLYEEALAKHEATDETTLDAEFAAERRAHRAQLTAERDRYAQAAADGRAVRERLER